MLNGLFGFAGLLGSVKALYGGGAGTGADGGGGGGAGACCPAVAVNANVGTGWSVDTAQTVATADDRMDVRRFGLIEAFPQKLDEHRLDLSSGDLRSGDSVGWLIPYG